MRKGIYTYYKERLIEIGGSNKCLYLKSAAKKGAYDIGRILEGRGDKVSEFLEFLWTSKHFPLTLISNKEKKLILENLDIQSKLEKRTLDTSMLSGEELARASQKNDRVRREETNKAIEAEISKIKEIKRTVEEIEKETGRAELYVGYPFVFGSIQNGAARTLVKAPLLLFPVKIDIPDENTAEISINESEKIQLNRAFIFAYAQAKRISVDQLETEFEDLSEFPSISSIIKHLESFRIKFDGVEYDAKNIYNFGRFKEPDSKSPLSIRYAAVLTRYPLSNSIFNDYSLLEKKHLTNDAISELLHTEKKKHKVKARAKRVPKRKFRGNHTIKMLDYPQSKVVERVDECGNMVIYGPPGTGKSQTIVNIITDAIAKNKRVLVVSQKKAALDVVYNRLGTIAEKAMYITDETKEKRAFYQKCFDAHKMNLTASLVDVAALEREYTEIGMKIDEQTAKLDKIYNVLTAERPFGLSLMDMYAGSYNIQKNTTDYAVYTALTENADVLALGYKELSSALSDIKAKNLEALYYNFLESKEKNPIIDHLKPDIDIHTLSEVKGELSELMKTKKGFFSTAKYPLYRQVLTYYYELDDEKALGEAVRLEVRFAKRRGINADFKTVKEQFLITKEAIDSFSQGYEFLRRALSDDGYLAVIDNILRGNNAYLKFVYDALENYISLRDVNKIIEGLDKNKLSVLNFAYTFSKNYQSYTDVIEKLLPIRIYHEVIKYEEECKDDFSLTVDYENIKSRICRYKAEQTALSEQICHGKCSKSYDLLYDKSENNKDYLYQISKKQKYWPIRKFIEVYGEYVLTLFPCWLLSPENVSGILPLTKNLFDLVIFDEASQVFIESTIPSMYRGKNIVVAGDSKQLRPSTTFMKRYMGIDPETLDDYSVQAALEVESLLDLAVARYDSANLTYHYRSRSQELIDFSNHAFYSMALQIAPNISRNRENTPIVRHKVNGKWIDRKNVAEAKRVVEVLRDIFDTRKNNESIGIITFNADQQSCIADMIDKECAKNPDFRSYITREKVRTEGGEDMSLFIKNLENVQGDERDIIIFSIAYAENELGRLYTNFGSLSAEGGENRLNVAITRAKTKVIVVTSIEPEELKVETSKYEGPKLLKKYLEYVRAVSEKKSAEAASILESLDTAEIMPKAPAVIAPIEVQIKERLERLGYTVDINLGNKNSRISIAVYDEAHDRYLVGAELDRDAFAASDSCMERDVYKPRFLEARGWSIIRIWSRDWWLYPSKVIKSITSAAEKNRKKYS